MAKKKKKNENKIIFSKEVDDRINGIAVSLSFIIVGIILQFYSSLFGNVTSLVKVTFIIIGIITMLMEIERAIKKHKFKGLDNLGIAIFLLLVWIIFKYILNSLKFMPKIFFYISDIILLVPLLIFIYGFFLGILQLIYSIHLMQKEEKKKLNIVDVVSFIANLLSIYLIISQIMGIIK